MAAAATTPRHPAVEPSSHGSIPDPPTASHLYFERRRSFLSSGRRRSPSPATRRFPLRRRTIARGSARIHGLFR
ncbi:hypothetical protein M6B38_402625 [Iris pallida]|uniref:Uncharacterized protein n=1 Tax=Iris pallida TaxID=29817 RepID=A0AAX6FSK0_IRIPA|nr:hypothetical protein M6B38_402625 [Iris pallida]